MSIDTMVKKVLANVMDFDMHNLFYPNPLLDEMEDAATDSKVVMPDPYLRERQYGRSPLIIRPKYTGDFLEKLKEPFQGKSLDVEAADEDNLKDFSMPSEMLKHQEKPTPRVVIDEYYDFNRPGDQAGGEDLDDYWKRDWENTDSPEISEDKWLRMWTRPEESNHHQARKIAASFIAPKSDMARRVIVGYLAGPKPNVIKIAKKMSDLMRSKINGGKDVNPSDVTVRIKRNEPRAGRFTFYTDSPGPASPGYSKPYVTAFEFIPRGTIRDTNKLDVRVSCTCPSWVMYGAQYKAVMEDYLYGPIRPVFAPPRKRDPAGTFYACKHVIACAKWISQNFLKLPTMAPELKKRLQVTKKYKFDIKAPEEVIKIPKDLMNVLKRPKVKSYISIWDQDPTKRKKLMKQLTNPEEIALLAFKFPSTASTLAAERLKELQRNPELKGEATELLDEIGQLFGEAPTKPLAMPAELKSIEDDQSFVETIKDLDTKADLLKSRIINKITDPDKLGYLRYRFNHDEAILSSVLYNLKKLSQKTKDLEEKKKAEHWIKSLIGG